MAWIPDAGCAALATRSCVRRASDGIRECSSALRTAGSGTVRNRSRTRLSSSASVIRWAVCWLRSDPPSTRDSPSKAWLPHARHQGLLLMLISSHWTQKVADCRGTKGTSLKVEPYTVLPNMIAESSLRSGFVEGNDRASGAKVAALVPRVEKPGDTSRPEAYFRARH